MCLCAPRLPPLCIATHQTAAAPPRLDGRATGASAASFLIRRRHQPPPHHLGAAPRRTFPASLRRRVSASAPLRRWRTLLPAEGTRGHESFGDKGMKRCGEKLTCGPTFVLEDLSKGKNDPAHYFTRIQNRKLIFSFLQCPMANFHF
jgi:hypothetical protein